MQLSARPASVLRAADADHLEARRNIVQHLADTFADLVNLTTATRAGAGSDIERHILALEMIRQTETAFDGWLWPRFRSRRLRQSCLGAGDIGVEVFEAKLQLIVIETFGTATELAALQRLDEITEPVDLGLRLAALVITLGDKDADHRVQRADVFGQSIEIDSHAPDFMFKNELQRP